MQLEFARLRVAAPDNDLLLVDRNELAGNGIAAVIIGRDGDTLAQPAAASVTAAWPLDRGGTRVACDRQCLLGVEGRTRAVTERRHAREPRLGRIAVGEQIEILEVAGDE